MRTRFIFFSLLFITLRLSAQQPLFINYSLKEGLPSSEVYDVLEDRNGYIWFATDAGVSRYDGYRFHNYTSADGLPDNTVFGLTEDRHGRIWFRTLSGQLAWWKDDTIHRIGANTKILSEQHKNFTISIYVDKGDTVWCGINSTEGYYYKIAPPYEAANMQVIYYAASVKRGTCIHWFDNDSGFICNCYGSYVDSTFLLSYYEGENFSHYAISRKISYMPRNIPMFCRVKGNQFIWAGSNGKAAIVEDTLSYDVVIPTEKIISAKITSEGAWLGFLRLGVFFYPGNNFKKPPVNYLNDFSVTCVIEDHEGGKWFSTLENGVYYLPPADFRIYNQQTGFTDNKFFSVYAENDSSIWVGSRNGRWCNLTNGQPGKCNETKTGLNVVSIDEAMPGWLFITSSESSLYELSTGKIISLVNPELNYRNPLMYTFAKNGDGTGWAIGKEKLYRFSLPDAKILSEFVTPVRIDCSCFGPDGVLWLGSLSGLWSFSNGKFTDHSSDDPLLKNRIEFIRFDANGTMWMATRGAGVLYRGKDKKVQRLSSGDGLASDICRSLFIDKENYIWVASNHGISCIDQRNGKTSIHNFGIAGDLLGEVNSITRTGNTIWAGTSQGLVSFDAHFVFLPPSNPPIHMVSVSVNGKNFRSDAPMKLKYDENSLSFSFVGLSYKAHGNIFYRYRLEGLETEWTVTTATQIQYATLPPGDYRFVVTVIRADGTVGLNTASFGFTIFAPFWKTWWFITLCAAFIIVAIILLFRYRLKLERDRSKTANRITLLELTALRAQMNPHFIFNAMNSIQHFILNNDKLSAQKYLSQFSRLIRGVLENSKQSTITLDQEIEALKLYTGLEKLRATRPFTVTIETADDVKTEVLRIPPLIIQPYVENAILHGLMPLLDREGHLSISFRMSENLLQCTIDDNGVGRQKAKSRSQTDIHRSVGLSITGRRIEILNQDNKETIGVTIEDKISAEGTPAGTRVVLLIPVK